MSGAVKIITPHRDGCAGRWGDYRANPEIVVGCTDWGCGCKGEAVVNISALEAEVERLLALATELAHQGYGSTPQHELSVAERKLHDLAAKARAALDDCSGDPERAS